MKFFKKTLKTCREYFYDHPTLRKILEYLFTTLGAIISAFLFAFGYKAFVDPIVNGQEIGVLVTGGASGLSQIVVKLFEIFGFPVNSLAPFGDFYWNYIMQSTAYVLINLPIFTPAIKISNVTTIEIITYFQFLKKKLFLYLDFKSFCKSFFKDSTNLEK